MNGSILFRNVWGRPAAGGDGRAGFTAFCNYNRRTRAGGMQMGGRGWWVYVSRNASGRSGHGRGFRAPRGGDRVGDGFARRAEDGRTDDGAAGLLDLPPRRVDR